VGVEEADAYHRDADDREERDQQDAVGVDALGGGGLARPPGDLTNEEEGKYGHKQNYTCRCAVGCDDIVLIGGVALSATLEGVRIYADEGGDKNTGDGSQPEG